MPACLFKQKVPVFGAWHLPNFGGPLSLLMAKGVLLWPLWNQNFIPSILKWGQRLIWLEEKDKEQVAQQSAGTLMVLAVSSKAGKVPFYCYPGEFTADNSLSRVQVLFLNSHLFETHLWFSFFYLPEKIVHYNQTSFSFLCWECKDLFSPCANTTEMLTSLISFGRLIFFFKYVFSKVTFL